MCKIGSQTLESIYGGHRTNGICPTGIQAFIHFARINRECYFFSGGVIIFNIVQNPIFASPTHPEYGIEAVNTKLNGYVEQKLITKWSHETITFYSSDGRTSVVWIMIKA